MPGWKPHSLTGDLVGFWSLTVTGNLRLIFRLEDGDAYELDLLDLIDVPRLCLPLYAPYLLSKLSIQRQRTMTHAQNI